MNSLSSLKRLRLARCCLLSLLLRLHINALELRQTFLTDEATVMLSYAELHVWRSFTLGSAPKGCRTPQLGGEPARMHVSDGGEEEEGDAQPASAHASHALTRPIMCKRLISRHQRGQDCTSPTMTLRFPRCCGDFRNSSFLHAEKRRRQPQLV